MNASDALNALFAISLLLAGMLFYLALQPRALAVEVLPAAGGAAVRQTPVATGTILAAAQGETVTVRLSFRNGVYDPQVIRVKTGSRVRIEGDPNTLVGCMSVVTIPDFGISKLISQGDNVIEFVADKPGDHKMSCTMGMGNGVIRVGDNPEALSAAPPQGGGGGCGCGGRR